MAVLMALFLAAIITAVVLAIDYLAGSRSTAAHPPGAWPTRGEDRLAERLARGAIDDDEYRHRLALVREQHW
jgi:putative membrane protein